MSTNSGTRKCYICKQSGHQSKECPQATKAATAKPTPPQQTAAPVEPSSGTRKCYVCKQAGHTSKECPQAGKDGASRSASTSSSKDEKSDFKARLAEFKAQVAADPNAPKPLFCYLCGIVGHKERDCPRNSKKDEDKTCLKCGDPSHIARYCPTIANRTVYRQENKERTKGCYVCGKEGHHAEECPDLDVLAEEFPKFVSKLQSGMKLNVKVYNILLEKCAKALELNGALYLYQQMQQRNVTPNEDTMKHLLYLYDRGGKDQSRLKDIPQLKKRVHLLREIVTAQRYAKKTEEVKDNIVTHLVAYLHNPAARAEAQKCASLFDLAKHLKQVAGEGKIEGVSELSSQAARIALGTLKSLGRYHQKSKSCEFDIGKEGEDVTTPGRFSKNENEQPGASSKKKKKNKSSKKKKGESAMSNGEDIEMTDASASASLSASEKSSQQERKKRKAEDDDQTETQPEKKQKSSKEQPTDAAPAERKELSKKRKPETETSAAEDGVGKKAPKAKKSKA